MGRNETWEVNHRCEGSLKACCRVLKGYQKYGEKYDGWGLFKMTYDFDYAVTFSEHVASIKFCPFCGMELES